MAQMFFISIFYYTFVTVLFLASKTTRYTKNKTKYRCRPNLQIVYHHNQKKKKNLNKTLLTIIAFFKDILCYRRDRVEEEWKKASSKTKNKALIEEV